MGGPTGRGEKLISTRMMIMLLMMTVMKMIESVTESGVQDYFTFVIIKFKTWRLIPN